jgi:hypothetical protein
VALPVLPFLWWYSTRLGRELPVFPRRAQLEEDGPGEALQRELSADLTRLLSCGGYRERESRREREEREGEKREKGE